MQFEDYHNKLGSRSFTLRDNAVTPVERVSQPAPSPKKASALTTTTVALSMLAFNIAAFLPAGATPGAKPQARKVKPQAIAARPNVVKTAAKAKVVAKAAKALPAKPTVAQAPYMPKHRSVWAIRWAAAHPDQEAIFQAQLERRWRARHHLPITGVAKAVPASHAASKVAVVKHKAAKVAKAAFAPAKPAHAKAAAKPAKLVAAKPIVKTAAKPIVKTQAVAATIAVAPAAVMAAAHDSAARASAAKQTAAKVAAKPAAKPVVKIAAKPASNKAASRPTSKAHVRVVRLVRAHVAKTTVAPAHVQMRVAAIKSVVATARHYAAQPASTPARPVVAALRPASGEARQNQAAATSLQRSDDVTLDFVAADINDVLKALAVQTGANIVSSADVKGTVTVSLANVSLEQALDMVARLSGFEYAKVGNTYVVGTAHGIEALTGSSGSSAEQVTQVVTFNYASVDVITNAIKQRFPSVQVSVGTSIIGAKAGAGAKAFILTGDPAIVAQAKDLVVQVDSSMGANVANESTVAYRVKYASVPDVISILSGLVPALVITPGPSQGFTAKAPSASAAASSSGGTSQGTSGSGGASASGSSSSSSGGGATGGSQASATGPNMLLLTGADTDIARARQILDQIDIAPTQLLFETKVVEMSDDNERKLGLTYDFSGAHTSIGELLPPGVTPGGVEPDPEPGQILKGRTFGRTFINDFVTVQLQALQTDGKAKLLADPNISAIDGQPAQVFIGDNVNYVSSITTSTTGENITTASVQVGVILRVTGKVDSDGYITLNIHPEVSTIKDFLEVPGGGELPDVATRYADTTVRVKDGDTIAIGGLIQQNDVEKIQKVPILGDLPFFGQLFRFNDHEKSSDDVVFFLKTSVMKQS